MIPNTTNKITATIIPSKTMPKVQRTIWQTIKKAILKVALNTPINKMNPRTPSHTRKTPSKIDIKITPKAIFISLVLIFQPALSLS
jgi:hypothetical protein